MKKKWLILVLVTLLTYGCSQRRNPVTDVNFNWRDCLELNRYLKNSIWTFNDGEGLIFISDFELVKTTQKDSDKNFGHCSKLQIYNCNNHKPEIITNIGDYPYLKIGDKTYDFIEIKEDSFTLADFNDGKPCTFTRKEKVIEEKTGTYQYEGKTYSLYLSEYSGSIRHEETGRSFDVKILDSNHFRIEGTILSDIPVYHWWEDEEGNLHLLSEGYEVSGMSNEEIFQNFPVIVLEKIEE